MPQTVAIIGSAIAGPTLALHLLTHPVLRRRFRPVLYDASPPPTCPASSLPPTSPSPTPTPPYPKIHAHVRGAGATVGLFANGLYPLMRLGLGPALRRDGCEYQSMTTWQQTRRGLEHLASQDTAFYSPSLRSGVVFFERGALQRLLVDAVVERGGEVYWRTKAVGFEPQAGAGGHSRVRVMFNDGTTTTPDILVGADGAYSSVRRYILTNRDARTAGTRWLPDTTGMAGLYGVSAAARDAHATQPLSACQLIWLEAGFLTTGPCPGRKTRWDMVLPDPMNLHSPSGMYNSEIGDSGQSQSTAHWAAALEPSKYAPTTTLALLAHHAPIPHPYAGTFGALLDSAERIIHTPLRQRVWAAHEIQAGNAVLLGDAARLMLPTSGQGTGFAVEDATVLARELLRYSPDSRGGEGREGEGGGGESGGDGGHGTLGYVCGTLEYGEGAVGLVRRVGSRWQAQSQDVWPFSERVNVE